ncbi:class I lanthipeptide [uncultured Dokdonia sp.]|uniref:class I lanthipeptide n=1 Tax=uncultured Dokdonia sp. TaxID=575653 RepID=UPI003450B1F2
MKKKNNLNKLTLSKIIVSKLESLQMKEIYGGSMNGICRPPETRGHKCRTMNSCLN